ncbi:hypothetical protein F5X99DRAFT_425197 [Biscogniauxia marginata]|nr:hypothetical protein F5X99DRAFT_425197 [Biscogniauxia marginata]
MEQNGHEVTFTSVAAGPESGGADLNGYETTQKRKVSDTTEDDDMDVDTNHVDEKRVRLLPPLDTPDDVEMPPEIKNLRQRIDHLQFEAQSYRQLAESHHSDLQSSKKRQEKLARRLKQAKSAKDNFWRGLIQHQEDTTVIVKQLLKPWNRFLQVYNDMRLPIDERLHEGSLEMLLAQVLDAKLRQVVERAGREQNTMAGEQSDTASDGNAIMLQLPIRDLAALSLGADDGENQTDEKKMLVGKEKARGSEGKGKTEDQTEDEEL